ncbi:MAG: glycosyltransferase [Bacteroidales bacterium]|jgi:glycosyltransferase involved in cell wall biosynthesis|nr:glycosyltransferase [Bacteroidales bacterium]
MNDPHRIKLVLFSNTYPFGGGETFLADEIPYLAEQFHRITIFPLYRPEGEMRPHPASVDIATPLLPFDHKDRKGFLKKGLFNTAPFFFATKEFFRAVFGKRNKKAGLGRRLHIFFNYFLMLRTILGNKKLMEEVVRECCFADKIYFYWGDKSAMLIPFLKKLVKPNVEIMPMFCARFHGSDLYEEAKGYLPFRDMIMEHTDYAIPVSYNGMNYIKANYNPCPKIIEVWHLGSTHHDDNFHNSIAEESNVFRIVGCANTIPLKRTDLVVKAIQLIKEDKSAMGKIKERGFDRITYTHFGGGNLLQKLREDTKDEDIDFRGSRPHDEILKFYKEEGADLFILASRSEGIPVSIMEAMSYGIPVIATNVGGVSELFRNCPLGYIIDADITAEDLKDQIVEYILLPKEIHRQMKQNCYVNWQEEWDAKTNYTRFAEELLGV